MSRRLQQLVFWILLLISGEQRDAAIDMRVAHEVDATMQMEV